VISEFLEENYDEFFSHYSKLLQSDNYVTKRQSVKVSKGIEEVNDEHIYNV
jgi:calcium binding protein 39